MSSDENKARSLALAARALEPSRRSAFLERACGGDAALRKAVETILERGEEDTARGRAAQAGEADAAGSAGAVGAAEATGAAGDSTAHFDGPPASPSASTEPASKRTSSAGAVPARPGPGKRRGRKQGGHSGLSAAPSSANMWGQSSRFPPGTMIGGRYRIVGLLGRGERGEVYRADDLKVGQSVALKFLSSIDPSQQDLMARVMHELRLVRQVAHPNVCRVFDVGQYEGEPLVAMEFIDGENLASLLRRIGRLPRDKVVQITHQLCAGLAAAHDRGLLHRDLTPQNIMIDGRGYVRIIDFGIADAARPGDSGPVESPYRAPEQAIGRRSTAQSDLYALGAILYEMVSGRPPLRDDASVAADPETAEAPHLPDSVADEIDPRLERLIRRCLEPDPRRRPASAYSVAAALPGADPLAAALAAGQTPSPQLVAAAGRSEGLRPAIALGLLGAAIAGLVLVALLAGRSFLLPQAGMDLPTAVLADRAQRILADLGYDRPPADRISGWRLEAQAMRYQQRSGRRDWADPHAPALEFWYRQSPRHLVPINPLRGPSLHDPPAAVGGMATVRMSASGSLLSLRAVPQPRWMGDEDRGGERLSSGAGVPDALPWPRLFEAAALDMMAFEPVQPRGDPTVFADVVVAWRGENARGQAVHVEAAALRGRVVEFELLHAGRDSGAIAAAGAAAAAPAPDEPLIDGEAVPWQVAAAQKLRAILFISILSGGLLLAWHNLRFRRGDRIGAFRIATAIFITAMLTWVLVHGFVGDGAANMRHMLARIAVSLLLAAVVWVYYIAMEPYLRRLWPQVVISWTRLLTGRLRDPLVGRDVLIGGLFGIGAVLLMQLAALLPQWLDGPVPLPLLPPPAEPTLAPLLGTAPAIGTLLNLLGAAVWLGLTGMLLALLLRVLLRRTSLAAVAFCLLGATMLVLANEWRGVIPWLIALLIFAGAAAILMRVGLLAAVAAVFFCLTLLSHPITTDVSAWYAGIGLLGPGLLALILALAFHQALGSHSLLHELLGDEPHGRGA